MAYGDLLPGDIEVLRILNGEDVPGRCWGAAMADSCSMLKAKGLAAGSYEITREGRAFLASLDAPAPSPGDHHD